jgi:hypothetical protein
VFTGQPASPPTTDKFSHLTHQPVDCLHTSSRRVTACCLHRSLPFRRFWIDHSSPSRDGRIAHPRLLSGFASATAHDEPVDARPTATGHRAHIARRNLSPVGRRPQTTDLSRGTFEGDSTKFLGLELLEQLFHGHCDDPQYSHLEIRTSAGGCSPAIHYAATRFGR